MKKRLSVIIPGYNTCSAWWRRCVDSVRASCDVNDEIICVDDGSVDPVKRAWFDDDDRIMLFRKENGGLSSARNFGMSKANGVYITFVDSDDEVREGAFNKCIDKMISSRSDICVYGVKTIWVDEGLSNVDFSEDKAYGGLSPQNVLELVRKRLFNYACNKVYRRQFLEDNSLSFDKDGMPCEDVIFNLKCVMECAKWCTVDYVGYIYYRCGLTLLSSYKPSNLKGLRHGSQTWADYKNATHGAKKVLGKFGELGEDDLLRAEWANLWKPGSPLSLLGRYYWLKMHRRAIVGNGSIWVLMLKSVAFNFTRRYFYVRPIRRWNIRRQYPKAVEWKVDG